MKKIFAVLFSLSLVLSSCSGDDTQQKEALTTSNNVIHTKSGSYFTGYDFETIGIAHNNGLEAVYNKLLISDASSLDAQQRFDLVFSETKTFIRNSREFGAADPVIFNHTQPATHHSNNAEFIADLNKQILENLSSGFLKEKHTEINREFKNYAETEDYTSEKVISNLRVLETSIAIMKDELDDKEYFAIRSMISTGIHSILYWEAHLLEWEKLNPKNMETMRKDRGWGWFKETIGDMASADAAGAAVGAVWGFVSTVATGPGVVVGTASTAVAFACNGSAVAGVRAFF